AARAPGGPAPGRRQGPCLEPGGAPALRVGAETARDRHGAPQQLFAEGSRGRWTDVERELPGSRRMARRERGGDPAQSAAPQLPARRGRVRCHAWLTQTVPEL